VAQRRGFWRWAFDGAPRQMHRHGAERAAATALKSAINAGRAPDAETSGSICLIGAGPGAADLLTLRAVQRLQEADVIYYDRLVDPKVLELARRDAERVYVGKEVGACAWPQARINDVITRAAQRGQTVVRLKSGDPMVFGRAEEEMAAARAAGVPVEVVPGITAASAAASVLGQSLTERGVSDRITFATGTCRPGDAPPDIAGMLAPGSTVALYMAVSAAPELVASLLIAGHAPDMPVQVVASAARPDQVVLETTLAELPDAMRQSGVASPAILFLRNPKQGAVAQAVQGVIGSIGVAGSPSAASMNAATCNSTASPRGGPISWTATGNPLAVNPAGIDNAGRAAVVARNENRSQVS